MPTMKHGKHTKVAVDGYNLTRYFRDASASASVETAETTTFHAPGDAKTFVIGLNEGTVSLDGLFDGSAGAVYEALNGILNRNDVGFLVLPGGDDGVGTRTLFGASAQTSFEVSSPLGDVVSVSSELQVDGGVQIGVYLRESGTDGAFETVTAGGTAVTDDSPAHDNSASSSDGGVAHLQVMNNSLDVAISAKIQHSADNTTWADLSGATFTSVSAGSETAEQLTVSGTVNRYLRSKVEVPIGSGSAEVAVAFTRH